MSDLLTVKRASAAQGFDGLVHVDAWTRGSGAPVRLALQPDDAQQLAVELVIAAEREGRAG